VQEVDKGNTDEVKAIANDVVQNLEKINHHGQRASDIVKGMLQHSRSSSGVKEPTDINALCDEYLRLSYHGLRAKDKSFNAEFDTKFDTTLPLISVIPQDIGRVILNLINNAFYAVNVRQKMEHQVVIEVADNGTGMTEQVKEKIFQPFFTTKPTGEGTGLGLSLSFDIITKGHGGELRVETKEGIGTEFIIQLPIV
jgi:two-component system NtrC family sensor kinase